jgi:hypothetical protein
MRLAQGFIDREQEMKHMQQFLLKNPPTGITLVRMRVLPGVV